MRREATFAFITALGALVQPAAAQMDPQVCVAEQRELNTYVDGVQSDFQQKVEAAKARTQQRADEIRKDAPDAKGPDAVIGFDFDVKWGDQKLVLDLPEITMKEQRWSLDIPQVTMRLQEIIFHTPSVRMVPKKVGQYPEFHGFTVRWRDIIAHVPETFMEEQRIKTHIPEIKVDRTDMILHVPEFKMDRQEIILRVPEFTLKNIRIEAEKAKARGDELSTQAKAEMNSEVNTMKTALGSGLGTRVHNLFNCMRSDLRAKRSQVEQAFLAPVTQLSAAITQLESANARDKVAEVRAQLDDVMQRKAQALRQLDAQLGQLDSQEQSTVKQIVESLAKA